MMFDVLQELLQLVENFRADSIDYAVCGGLAMAVHGFVRATEDIDILVEADSLPRVRHAAARCGFRLQGGDVEFRSGARLTRLLKAEQSGEDYLILDLMLVTEATREAWNSREEINTRWGAIRVVNRPALKAMKQQAGRPQDLVDIQRLDEPDDIS